MFCCQCCGKDCRCQVDIYHAILCNHPYFCSKCMPEPENRFVACCIIARSFGGVLVSMQVCEFAEPSWSQFGASC